MRQFARHSLTASLLLPLAAAAQELPEPPPPTGADGEKKLWETEAELGLSTTSGNTNTTTTTGRVASDRTGERFALHLLAEGRFSEEGNETSSQRAHGLTQ
ncbi:MAG: DUF481 domain-containing protein, partial [Thiohalorhabdaceae bacterium]